MLSISRRFLATALHARRFSAIPDSSLTKGEQNIRSKLIEKFNPSTIHVQDVSGGCGDFYAITIASEAFKGLTMVKQHRLVTETLKKEIENIHGLQIKTMVQ